MYPFRKLAAKGEISPAAFLEGLRTGSTSSRAAGTACNIRKYQVDTSFFIKKVRVLYFLSAATSLRCWTAAGPRGEHEVFSDANIAK